MNAESNISQTLGIDQSLGHRKHRKWWFILALLAIAVVTTAGAWTLSEKSDAMRYETQLVRRGSLTVTVTATGNLQPINQVDVGTEVSGTVATVEVDYNNQVKVGEVLAQLDTSRLQAQVLQSKAALESAQAKVLEAQASVNETGKELARLKQVRELSDNKVPSQHDLDTAHTALERARAAEASAKAQVLEAEAILEANETDLTKAVIRSPINGIVLTRSVEPGQTVAASLQAPVLFTLAEDLTQMELQVDVDEADVGQVKEGQEATFTVDAYPDLTFPARITQVRYGSLTVDGVVTYKAVLDVDNSDLTLRPGMTATADITVKKIENAILVPNAALRFIPPVQEKELQSDSGSLINKLLPRRHGPRPRERIEPTGQGGKQRIWTIRNGQLVAIPVMTGATDGSMTEVTGGAVEPGTALVIDTVSTRG